MAGFKSTNLKNLSMQTKNLFLFGFIFLLLACNPNRIYKSHEKNLPNHRWHKDNVLEFNPNITDTVSSYRVYLALRHVYGFQHPGMKVKVTTITPSGQKETKTYTFPVFGKEQQYLSDCSGDICDLETVIEEGLVFKESGKYQYLIEHNMDVDPVRNVMSFGLIIEKETNGDLN